MKKLTLIFVALLMAGFATAQNKVFELMPGNGSEIVVRLSPEKPVLMPVDVNGTRAYMVDCPEGVPVLQAGAPDLAKMVTSVIIPGQGNMSVEILETEYYDIPDVDIVPSKGNLSRSIDPVDVPWTYGPEYTQDEFFPEVFAEASDPYILRDYRAQSLSFYPYRYNPVTRTLRVCTSITIRLYPDGGQGINELPSLKKPAAIQTDYAHIYERRFLNYSNEKYTPVEEDGNMLIICHGPYMSYMQEFVKWKKQKGIPVQMVNVATIGNAAQIKAYVANYYNTNGLTYLLLVGDAAQVPSSSTTAGDSDNDYSYILGSDHYPDIFVGRFSAESYDHVITQVQRSVEYEKAPDLTGTWYKKHIGIASSQGPGDDNEMDYAHVRVMQQKLQVYTYTNASEYFDGDQGGLDAAGDPTASMVKNDVDPGVGVILYTGHGWDQGWGTSSFSNVEADLLLNQNKLPFIWSVACVNGNFVSGTCFAEAWMRSVHLEDPTGAIAVLMSTINQSWNPPMAGQDEMVDLLVESLGANEKHSFGGISMSGCMKMNDEYGQGGFDMTDTWNLFGDPSVVLRTDIPQPMVVSHVTTLIVGTDNVDVNCNVEDALVCLTIDNEILGRGYVSGGIVNITFPALTNPDTILVTVTAYNKVPYFGNIYVIPPPTGPYVIKDVTILNDIAGNNNGKADYSEDVVLDMSLKNVGVSDALGVSAVISSSSPWITITSNSHPWGNISPGLSLMQNTAFAFSVDDSIPDQALVTFSLLMTDGSGNSWTSSFPISLQAPVLSAESMSVNDAGGGNGNGILEPGETALVNVAVKNTGHSTSPAVIANLACSLPGLTITSSSVNIGPLTPGQTLNASFGVTVGSGVPFGTTTQFGFHAQAGLYETDRNFPAVVGQYSENWESGGFMQYTWLSGGVGPWVIDNANAWEGSFCAKSALISHTDTTKLIISMDVLSNDSISFWRKVSSELNWDFLAFYMDGVPLGAWSGEEDWARVSFPVVAGHHTFSWWYYKDYVDYDPIGSDCGWVDYILFPPAMNLITGVSDVLGEKESYIRCWPNPSLGQFCIGYATDAQGEACLEITDVTGKTVASEKQPVSRGEFRFGSFPQGIYLVRITTANEILTSKMVVH
jgi:hypothetical protein